MEISAWSSGQGKYGINVGHPNRRMYFDTSWTDVELEIEGEVHHFRLLGGFQNRCPEIRDNDDRIIEDWLRRHGKLPWPHRKPPRVELLPLNGNRFRLTFATG